MPTPNSGKSHSPEAFVSPPNHCTPRRSHHAPLHRYHIAPWMHLKRIPNGIKIPLGLLSKEQGQHPLTEPLALSPLAKDGIHATKKCGKCIGTPTKDSFDHLACRQSWHSEMRRGSNTSHPKTGGRSIPAHWGGHPSRRQRQQRVYRNRVSDTCCLAEPFCKCLVPHKRLIPFEQVRRMLAQPSSYATIPPQDFSIRTETEAIVHIAFEIFQETSKANTRFGRLRTRGEGCA